MVYTTVAKELTAQLIGSRNIANPGYIAIGTGSGTALAANTALVSEQDRNAVGSPINITTRFITWTANFSSAEMSGLGLTEFGLGNLTSGGSIWTRQAFGSQLFDGNTELQVDIEVEVV